MITRYSCVFMLIIKAKKVFWKYLGISALRCCLHRLSIDEKILLVD